MNKFAMYNAARNGDLERVKQLIEAGMPMDSLDEFGLAPLHVAVYFGKYELAELMINSGCDIEFKDRHGCTPVRIAADCGSKNKVELLIRRGAQVNCADEDGRTLLHEVSCRNGWTDIVRLILDNGEADLNAVDQFGDTPLMCAIRGGFEEVAALLIRAGADVNRSDFFKMTALHLAVERRLTGVIQILLEQEGLDLDDACISKNFFLKENLLKDVEFCTRCVVNKFNRQSLPALNGIASFARRLPNVDNFKLGARQIDEVRNLVKCEIERHTFCNVVKIRPIALSALCVLSLITCQSGTKRVASPDFGHSSIKKNRN